MHTYAKKELDPVNLVRVRFGFQFVSWPPRNFVSDGQQLSFQAMLSTDRSFGSNRSSATQIVAECERSESGDNKIKLLGGQGRCC